MKISIWLAVLAIFGTISSSSPYSTYCSFSMALSYQVIGSVYQCITTITTSAGPTDLISEITGNHLANKTSDDVQMFTVAGLRRLAFIPRGVTIHFPNIIALYMYDMAIESFTGDEFNEFPRLQWLSYSNSNLTTISSRLFDATPGFVYGNFYANKIERVGRDLFARFNASQLVRLNFNQNVCTQREAGNYTSIVALIEELKVVCPYDDEEGLPPLTTDDPTTVATTLTTLIRTTTSTPEPTTTTSQTTTTTTTTTSNPTTTTTAILTCFDGKIEDFVCDLNDHIDVVQLDLSTTKDEIQDQLDHTKKRVNDLQNELVQTTERFEATISEMRDEMQWMRDEILRMTTNPCAC
jgi:hypothetical protein